MVSCDLTRKQTEEPIARVNDNYLYHSDIKDLIVEGMSKDDSTLVVSNYINRWATQQLLMDGALLNISPNKQEEYNKLIEQYKNDLYTKAYLEALVNKNLDAKVTPEQAKIYYDKNTEAFKLNEELVKFRYIYLDKNRQDLSDITKKMKRFNTEDKRYLDSISIQFKAYSLNDSIWVKTSQMLNKIPMLAQEDKSKLLKKSNFIQRNDSIGLYLMQINDVLERNDTAPLEFVRPTIDQIVINNRKLQLIKQLQTDITKDAIKNKQFEIFN